VQRGHDKIINDYRANRFTVNFRPWCFLQGYPALFQRRGWSQGGFAFANDSNTPTLRVVSLHRLLVQRGTEYTDSTRTVFATSTLPTPSPTGVPVREGTIVRTPTDRTGRGLTVVTLPPS
jgi:hypothetical protein